MEHEIELQVMPSGNVAVYRGNGFIPTEKLTEEERLFVLDKVIKELCGNGFPTNCEIHTGYVEEKDGHGFVSVPANMFANDEEVTVIICRRN